MEATFGQRLEEGEEESGCPSNLASSVRPPAGAERGGGEEALVGLQARGDGAQPEGGGDAGDARQQGTGQSLGVEATFS